MEFVSNVYKEDGRDVIQCNIRDITDRRRMEEEREREKQATEASRDRAEANEAELAAADRRKNEFLAMLAHELRNPLAAIRNAVTARGPLGHQGGPRMEPGRHRPAGRSNFAHLIDDLLDVSRITQGKIQLRKAVIDAAPVLRNAVEAVRPLVEERKHELLLSFTSTRPEDRGRHDPARADARQPPDQRREVHARRGAASSSSPGVEGDEFVCRVRDNGVGISPELLPRMFDLFAQADRSLARSEGGLGIGLTLVRSLAELHGGTVTATSDGPGKGSEFVLRLPAALGPCPGRSPSPKEGRESAPPRLAGARRR